MLNGLVTVIDRRLRALHGVTEYSHSSHCIFRIQVAASKRYVALADGTTIHIGDRIILLHLWNEHIPPFPLDGPTLGWAVGISRRLGKSLRELEKFLASRPDLDDIQAIKAEMTLSAAERGDQFFLLASKYGFEPVEAPKLGWLGRLHRLGENILIAMLVLRYNPASFRGDTLRRNGTPAFLSRTALRERCKSSLSNADSRDQRDPPGLAGAVG